MSSIVLHNFDVIHCRDSVSLSLTSVLVSVFTYAFMAVFKSAISDINASSTAFMSSKFAYYLVCMQGWMHFYHLRNASASSSLASKSFEKASMSNPGTASVSRFCRCDSIIAEYSNCAPRGIVAAKERGD